MVDAALDWLADISFDGVPCVPGVPSRFSAISHGTPMRAAGVPGVPQPGTEHLGTPAEHLCEAHNSLKLRVEHLGTPRTPKNNVAGREIPQSVASFPPAEIARGLAALRTLAAPLGVDCNGWRQVVADAGRLIAEGWAEDALALGWTALDLFGCEPLGSDDDYRNGLAVWLIGRPLVLLDADSAIARVDARRFVFSRKRDRSGCVLLWELGR